MQHVRSMLQYFREFCTAYPAVLSGYIIYSYLFISMIRFFLRAKADAIAVGDVFDIFSALPFMWLLAVSLVKVIEVRNKLHQSEQQRLLDRQQLQNKETQLATMKEVVKGLQHHINNPLAIISLLMVPLKRGARNNHTVLDYANQIEGASKRIGTALTDFSRTHLYDVDCVGSVVGDIAMPFRVENNSTLPPARREDLERFSKSSREGKNHTLMTDARLAASLAIPPTFRSKA